jgi:hypothetical protein
VTALDALEREAATLAAVPHAERISVLAEALFAADLAIQQAERVRVETLAAIDCEASQ